MARKSRSSRQPAKIEQQARAADRWQFVGVAVLLLAAVSVAYWPAIHGQFIWDDDVHVTLPELRGVDGLGRIWFDIGATHQYYPLLHTLFWVEYQLWQQNPLGYHIANLLLHVTAACLVYLVVRKLRIPGALLAAAIFALHPIQVESVAWITEQKNTLSTVFYLSAVLVYLQFDESRARSSYLGALGLFALALFSKTVTATLPAALLVIFWYQRGTLSWRRDVQPLIPFFLLGAVAGLLTAWVEHRFIGAQGSEFLLSWGQRALLMGRIPWFYLRQLLWPENLVFIYPRWQVDPAEAWQWLFPLATIVMLIALWLFRNRSRAPLAASLFFIGTLFPVLGLFNIFPFRYSFVADHFQYLAGLGIIVLLAGATTTAIARLAPSWQFLRPAIGIALPTVLAVLTWKQSAIYGNVFTLYEATIQRNPTCWMAYNNLGMELANRGQQPQALPYYLKALELNPDYPEAHNNLGNVLKQQGQLREAIDHYRRALQLRNDFPEAHSNLGVALVDAGQLPEAIEQYKQAISFRPDYDLAHFNLGIALNRTGQPQAAINEFQQALRIRPQFTEAYQQLASIYAQSNRPAEALAAGQQALNLARAQGRTALAAQLEKWLSDQTAGGQDPDKPSPSNPSRP